MLKTPGKPSTSNNAALSVFLRVRPPGAPGADVDKLTGRRTYQILDDQATLRTFPPLSAGHSRTINRQVGAGGGGVRPCICCWTIDHAFSKGRSLTYHRWSIDPSCFVEGGSKIFS